VAEEVRPAGVAVDGRLAERLYVRAGAARWRVPPATFAAALEASAAKAFAGRTPGGRELERYLTSLHLQDLALACGCAEGDEEAWEHMVREWRPILYRAADALDPGGGAREIADALYAELYGTETRAGARRSLFRYFHGRSSLGTWLRAVLSQRYVDGVRARRRLTTLPEDDTDAALTARAQARDPERDRYVTLVQQALEQTVGELAPRDRLRLGCYYARQLTLAETGRLLHEHEATVSRQLARTRRELRRAIEARLRAAGLGRDEIDSCFASVAEDAGPLDLDALLAPPRKTAGADRSSR
jgi:RNA polymerase sigma factor (sigma-70 family)